MEQVLDCLQQINSALQTSPYVPGKRQYWSSIWAVNIHGLKQITLHSAMIMMELIAINKLCNYESADALKCSEAIAMSCPPTTEWYQLHQNVKPTKIQEYAKEKSATLPKEVSHSWHQSKTIYISQSLLSHLFICELNVI